MCSQLFDTPKGVFYVGQCGVFGVCAPFLPCFAGRGFRKRFDPKFRKRFDPNSADFAGGKNRRSGDCCGRFPPSGFMAAYRARGADTPSGRNGENAIL